MSQSTNTHPTPSIGFCCPLTSLSTPSAHCCEGSILGMLPFPDIIRALSSQHLPPSQREEIHVLDPSLSNHPVVAGCGWFAAVTFSPSFFSPSSSASYLTKAVISGQVKTLQLPSPFTCGVDWVKVDELEDVLKCESTGRVWEVLCWADPELLGSQVLVGSAMEDERGERFLKMGPRGGFGR